MRCLEDASASALGEAGNQPKASHCKQAGGLCGVGCGSGRCGGGWAEFWWAACGVLPSAKNPLAQNIVDSAVGWCLCSATDGAL